VCMQLLSSIAHGQVSRRAMSPLLRSALAAAIRVQLGRSHLESANGSFHAENAQDQVAVFDDLPAGLALLQPDSGAYPVGHRSMKKTYKHPPFAIGGNHAASKPPA